MLNDNNAGTSPHAWTLNDANCISGAPGAYLVVGGASAQGATPNATLAGSSATLLLSSSSAVPLQLRLSAGITVVDEATYPAAATEGRSYRLKPGFLTAVANDTAANWCTGTTTYPTGSWGSPGAANDSCP